MYQWYEDNTERFWLCISILLAILWSLGFLLRLSWLVLALLLFASTFVAFVWGGIGLVYLGFSLAGIQDDWSVCNDD